MLKKNHYQARNEIGTYPTFTTLESVQMRSNPLSWRCSNENRKNFFEYFFSSYRALDIVVGIFKYLKVYAPPQIQDLNVSKSVFDFLHLLACIFTTTMKHESPIVQIGPFDTHLYVTKIDFVSCDLTLIFFVGRTGSRCHIERENPKYDFNFV